MKLNSEESTTKIWFIIGVFISVLIKLFISYKNDLSNDELFSIYHAQMSISELFKELSTGNNPPLFESILHFWIGIFGIGKFSVRSLSIIFSIISLFYIYKISNFINPNNKKVSVFTIIFFSLSYSLSSLQTEARSYSLMILLILGSSYYFLNLIKFGNSDRKHGILFGIFTLLGWYTHFFTIWIFIVQIYFLIRFYKKNKGILNYFLIPVLFFLPYVKILFVRFMETGKTGTWVEPATISSLYYMILNACNTPIVTISFLLLFIYFTIKSIQQKNIEKKYLVLWFWFPFWVMFLFSLPHKLAIPMFIDRYVSFVFPSFFIGASLMISEVFNQFNKSKYVVIGYLVLSVLIVVGIRPKYYSNVFREFSELKNHEEYKKSVLIQSYYCAFSYLYYNDLNSFRNYSNTDIYIHMEKQLIGKSVFTLRETSISNFHKNEHPEMSFIAGELTRESEIKMANKFFEQNDYKTRNSLFHGGNQRIDFMQHSH